MPTITMVPACSGPSGIGRLCADPCSSGLHDSYPMSHTSLDRGGIELCLVTSKLWFRSTYAKLRLRKIFKSYFDEFTHHFENPYWYQNVRNQNIFHLRYIRPTHAITRPAKLKKPKNQCLAPFWKPILVKMENSLDVTSIVRVSTLFVHKKLIYAYANDFHMIFKFHRIWNRDNLLIMTSLVKFRLQNQINVSQKIFSWSFVHI